MQQLFLKFPIKSTYLTEDFFLSSANHDAFNYLNQWPNWGNNVYSRIILLYGESGSGKTHLAHIWQRLSNARIIDVSECNNLHSLLAEKALILEDIATIDETLLLHLINFARENQQYLLLTSTLSPRQLSFKLADLQSRILAIPSVAINSPDQDLLKAVLLKYLSERQLQINAATLDYIFLRIDRSFDQLMKFIEKLDQLSNESKRSITIPLIKEVFAKS